MRQGIAYHRDPGTTAVYMLPVFGMLTGGVVAGVNIVIPFILRGIVCRALFRGVTAVGKFVFISDPAPGAINS
jgi:hypothetical protein